MKIVSVRKHLGATVNFFKLGNEIKAQQNEQDTAHH